MKRRSRNEKRDRDEQCKERRKGKVEDKMECMQQRSLTEAPKVLEEHDAASQGVCGSALLVVGTYHSVMAGLLLKKNTFPIIFSVKHHVGCMNGVALSDKYVATCGADERVFLFTNKLHTRGASAAHRQAQESGGSPTVRLADLGSLAPPAEVMCVAFANASQYLLCGCGNGQLLVFRTRDWSLSAQLPVHEKGLRQLALHPRSNGSLCVTIGEDRSVVVLDLAKLRLMAKWKFTSRWTSADREGVTASGSGSCKPSWDAHRREEPLAVCFSPTGVYWAVRSRFSVVVYRTTTMEMAYVLRLSQPQPDEELHALTFASDNVLLLGNESGQLLYAVFPLTAPPDESNGIGLALRPVRLHYPDAQLQCDAEATAKRGSSRQKHPLRHTSRVKAILHKGQTVFSVDSAGVLIDWTLRMVQDEKGQMREGEEGDTEVELVYITSANCQGRVTSLDVLAL